MPAPIVEEPLYPVRPKDGRPLPVKGVIVSPGPIYPGGDGFPGGIGSGVKVTIQHRHPPEEELIPPPGPGEYDPEDPYGHGWQSRERRERLWGWRTGRGYYPRPDPDRPTREGSVLRDESSPKKTGDRSAGLGISRDAFLTPGPGTYNDETRCVYHPPDLVSTWRLHPVYGGRQEESNSRFTVPGKTLLNQLSPRKPSGVPGPGAYEPRGDRRGGGELGQKGTESARNRQGRPPTPTSKAQDQTQVPGPGHYDQSQLSCAKQALVRPIGMMGRPLTPIVEDAPGPGAYAPGAPKASPREPAQPGWECARCGERNAQQLVKCQGAGCGAARPSAHDADRPVRKHVHGSRWVKPKPPKPKEQCADGRDYPSRGTSDFGRHGAGVSIAPSQGSIRSPRCPFQKGETVMVLLTASAPSGTRAVIVDHAGGPPPSGVVYKVRVERTKEIREVDGSLVRKTDPCSTGPGQYDLEAAGRFGRSGKHYTMQLPNARTSMAVSEARKTAGNPGPPEYFRDGSEHPRQLGKGAPAHSLGQRLQPRPPPRLESDHPSAGIRDDAQPPSDFGPHASGRPGPVLSFRPAVKVKVIGDIDEVRELCEAAGIREWKDGKEWRYHRGPADDTELAKDDYCGLEGTLITHGGMVRGRAGPNHPGPNRPDEGAEDGAESPHGRGAPWAPYSNRSRETVRVVFNDPQREANGAFCSQTGGWVEWSYPTAALQRNGIPFDEGNSRDGWAAPQTKAPGGPASYNPTATTSIGCVRERRNPRGGVVVEVPGVTIKGKPPPPQPPQVPGPGQHWEDEQPSTLSARAAFIGTGA
eukprot:TRINITY_DN5563_c0_g4_i1.p1 TRINITY_DN5563_c0_g4~~TRINITY_DN5563_c0_g4_i1.p1  ORF type:complete len:810 (+),score=144.35 TRINITY_DN5563_c0_g4_i1:88-2517(+)